MRPMLMSAGPCGQLRTEKKDKTKREKQVGKTAHVERGAMSATSKVKNSSRRVTHTLNELTRGRDRLLEYKGVPSCITRDRPTK